MRTRDEATLWLPGLDPSGAALAPEPEDIAERRRALDPTSSFIVQAPAGSGKTELLIQRFLALLARVAEPEAVVAITFTVKAAGEMRARVLEALRKAARNEEAASAHERFTMELAGQALARDSVRGWDLLNNPDRLRIQTIDALSMSITRQMPWMARFGAMPSVVEDAREWYRVAARRTIEMLGGGGTVADAAACLLSHLDNDAARAVDLLARMLETRDHWIRVMHRGDDLIVVREALETSLARIVALHLARLRDSVPAGCRGELLELARYAGANVQQSDPVIARCAGLSALPECVDSWQGLVRLMLTGKGEWRKRPDRSIGFPPYDKRKKQRFEALLASLAGAEEFRSLLAQVPRLPASRYEESQWEVLAALFQLLRVTAAQLRLVFAETGQVDFTEIAQAAHRALGTAEQPADLALTMGARIEHLLLDEFQDTSVTQFELLRALTAGWEPGDRRTLFLVGDPMQSIYRFRQAEVALFLNVCESGIGALEPAPLGLSVNFRSARSIVDWVNGVFREVFPELPDAHAGAVPYTASTAFRDGSAESAVTLHPFAGRNDPGEAALVAELAGRALRESARNRIAVLVRSRAHLAAIADGLRDRGIPYRAIEIQALAEKSVIQDLLAITRALLHLADRVAWLAVLRAPWCGLTLAALDRIAAVDREQPIWSALEDAASVLDSESAGRVARVVPTLAAGVAMRGRVPVAQLVERTWIGLGGDRIADENELADARAFFDLLEETGAGGDAGDLEVLSRRVAELFANPDAGAGDAIELMTIHKAKGLEFDMVIVPGLGKRPKVDEPALLLWSEHPSGDGTDLLMAPIAGSGGDCTYDFIRREIEAKGRHESQRLLYVACTRARTALHLIGHVDLKQDNGEVTLQDPPRDSLLAHLWPIVRPQFEAALDAAGEGAAGDNAGARRRTLLRRIKLGAMTAAEPVLDVSAPVAAAHFELGTEDPKRRAGVLVHRMLERMAREGAGGWNRERIADLRPAWRISLAQDGVAPDSIETVCDRIEQALVTTMEDPNGRRLLEHHDRAQSEFAVSGVIDGEVRHLVIDRTFVAPDGVRWIVDFKTSEPDGDDFAAFLDTEKRQYQAQLRGYSTVLSALDGGGSIRVGLYFPMIGRWIEWDPFG